MIVETYGDITQINKGIILQGVNCQGAMGAGLAKAIMTKWPIVKPAYQDFVKGYVQALSREDLLGRVQFIEVDKDLFVANGFTQFLYGYDGKKYAIPSAISSVLFTAKVQARGKGLPLHTVRVGCGLGGLDWATEVSPIFSTIFKDFDVVIHQP